MILQKELSELEESSFDVEKFRIELSETEISLKRVERDIRNGDHEVYQLTQ